MLIKKDYNIHNLFIKSNYKRIKNHKILTTIAQSNIPRFYTIEPITTQISSLIDLDKKETQHAISSLRLKINNTIEICDGKGNIVKGKITSIHPKKQTTTILIEELRHEEWQGIKITLIVACGNLKGGRGDWLIEKATELNAYKFIPLITERCHNEIKYERWNRVSQAAMKQCLRSHMLKIEKSINLNNLENILNDKLCIIALMDSKSSMNDLNEILKLNKKEIVVIIGPEGDFTENEKEILLNNGCYSVNLGNNRLRVETASIALLSYIRIIKIT